MACCQPLCEFHKRRLDSQKALSWKPVLVAFYVHFDGDVYDKSQLSRCYVHRGVCQGHLCSHVVDPTIRDMESEAVHPVENASCLIMQLLIDGKQCHIESST